AAAPPEDALVRVEAAVPLEPGPSAPSIPLRPGSRRLDVAKNKPVVAQPSPPLRVRRAVPVAPNEANVAAAGSASSSPTVMRALPVDASSPAVAIASTTGATWKTFAPGQVPAGRMVDPAGLREVANNGTQGQRVYLRGEFVVNFADGNRAVLRPTAGEGSNQLSRQARIIVDYPAGAPLPQPGSTLSRDASRPFEVTEVRQQSDCLLNVFVR
ncbi:MAG: hypothetical protein ACREP1_07340, partial [Rhodanobacteraceae bacterium]